MEIDNASQKLFAVVTGASSGIGYELAKQFAKNGYDLLIASKGPELVEAKQALQSLGADVQCLRVDLASAAGVEKLYASIIKTGRPVDALAINAGVGVGGKFATETDFMEEINVINLNVLSPVHLTKLILEDMIERGQGKILFTSSISATTPVPYEAVYAASKAFLFSFAESIRSEVKNTGVTITALLPGPTDTNFFARAGLEGTKVGDEMKYENRPEEVARQGFEAMMAGKDHVFAASLRTKIEGYINKFFPETIKAEYHKYLSSPKSQHP